jgi:hypothetical protein
MAQVVQPALGMMPAYFDTPQARCMLVAISGQEADWTARIQFHGPARGLWQCEPTGVRDVMQLGITQPHVSAVCKVRKMPATPDAVYAALPSDDLLACVVARLILWADPAPLPAIGDQDAAWQCYLRNWRPGRPRPADWPNFYQPAAQLAAPAEA